MSTIAILLYVIVYVIGHLALFAFFGLAIYGDMEDFLAALVDWLRRLFSLELFFGDAMPGFRLLAWMICVGSVLLGEHTLLGSAT